MSRLTRRTAGAGALLALSACGIEKGTPPMYGLIGKMKAAPGERDKLARILLEGLADMPGCLSYVVAADPADLDALWITEAWTDAEAHRASLSLPSVQAAIVKARPIIAGMERIAETQPIGGHGLT
jgi:quinol monooxygenase YgiN